MQKIKAQTNQQKYAGVSVFTSNMIMTLDKRLGTLDSKQCYTCNKCKVPKCLTPRDCKQVIVVKKKAKIMYLIINKV